MWARQLFDANYIIWNWYWHLFVMLFTVFGSSLRVQMAGPTAVACGVVCGHCFTIKYIQTHVIPIRNTNWWKKKSELGNPKNPTTTRSFQTDWSFRNGHSFGCCCLWLDDCCPIACCRMSFWWFLWLWRSDVGENKFSGRCAVKPIISHFHRFVAVEG